MRSNHDEAIAAFTAAIEAADKGKASAQLQMYPLFLNLLRFIKIRTTATLSCNPCKKYVRGDVPGNDNDNNKPLTSFSSHVCPAPSWAALCPGVSTAPTRPSSAPQSPS